MKKCGKKLCSKTTKSLQPRSKIPSSKTARGSLQGGGGFRPIIRDTALPGIRPSPAYGPPLGVSRKLITKALGGGPYAGGGVYPATYACCLPGEAAILKAQLRKMARSFLCDVGNKSTHKMGIFYILRISSQKNRAAFGRAENNNKKGNEKTQ